MPSASSGGGSSGLTDATALYLVNHVFLPPRLPQKSDYDPDLDAALIQATLTGLQAFREWMEAGESELIDQALRMVDRMHRVHCNGRVMESELRNAMDDLIQNGIPIALQIRAQNAGVLISKEPDQIRIDTFELSPLNNAIMTTKGRLLRSFPGSAVALDLDDFRQPEFQATVVQMLSNMSSEAVGGMQTQANKAGALHDEERDTTHPGIVSELFIGFLLSIGRPASVLTITKCTRDDILWKDTLTPWRRSALWMLVRVALHLTFVRRLNCTRLYKEAMLAIMAKILDDVSVLNLPSDLLHCMKAKLAQRLLKMGPNVGARVFAQVRSIMEGTHAVLESRWRDIQTNNARDLDIGRLAALDFDNDTRLRLPALDNYIASFNNRNTNVVESNFTPASAFVKFPAQHLPRLAPQMFTDGSYAVLNLASFEQWVALHSPNWAEEHIDDSSMCQSLSALIKEYHTRAQFHYAGNPEALSTMTLTIFELWTACDLIAIAGCKLLQQYEPGIPTSQLQNLLLPFKDQTNKLHDVERYIARRHADARFPFRKIFLDNSSADSFAATSFDQCPKLQEELKRIETWATNMRQEKLSELKKLKEEYARLRKLHDELSCEYIVVIIDQRNYQTEKQHSGSCRRCSYQTQAEKLAIGIHEWPLPAAKERAKVVIFELNAPAWFTAWRDATFYLLRDVLKSEYYNRSGPRASYPLRDDPHLRAFASLSPVHRIGLLSQDKPHIVTHRRNMPVSTATELTVCTKNGLDYRYFDFDGDCFVQELTHNDNVPQLCTYQLPARSAALQKYLFRPASAPSGPAPNTAIAAQSDIPRHVTLEEGKDLCTLLLGYRIQWINLLAQLEAPSVDFKKEETALFVFQCLYQAGPPDSSGSLLRASHKAIDNIPFISGMVDSLGQALNRVKENWESAQALGVFSAIACRLLTLTPSPDIANRCIKFLVIARDTALSWFRTLREKSYRANASEERMELKSKSVEVALVCALCLDVDDAYLERLLSVSNGASILIECSIAIHGGRSAHAATNQSVFGLQSMRLSKLLHRAYPVLKSRHTSVQHAVPPVYHHGRPWSSLEGSADHWLCTEPAPVSHGTLQVHYNILSGELLVNGIPLTRPPAEYENHPMWSHLFGNAAVEVGPSNVPGMKFAAKIQHRGYDVYFALSHVAQFSVLSDPDLIVRASKHSTDYESIPSRLFHEELPATFVHDMIQWYNHSNHTVEFRSRDHPWDEASADSWVLTRCTSTSTWRLERHGNCVIGSQSKTAVVINHILDPLTKPEKIIAVSMTSGTCVQVNLPKLPLEFSLSSGKTHLESRQFRGMYVDKDQSLGTLIGVPKLMLRNSDGHRMVLVPEGSASVFQSGDHAFVTIDKDSIVKVHPLSEDTLLGRLIDNGGLQGKLYLAYLHDLSSFCLPDPLLRKTGTEHSLAILRSAAVRSFSQLSQANIATLERIAALTPKRVFYPVNEQVMQTISWQFGLSFMSQHGHFRELVAELFDAAEQYQVLFEDATLHRPELEKCDKSLLERDLLRTATFRVSEFGAEQHCSQWDRTYQARDYFEAPARFFRAYSMASTIYQGLATYHWDLPYSGYLWSVFLAKSHVYGPDAELSASFLQYTGSTATAGFDFAYLLPVHKLFKKHDTKDKFALMAWLSAVIATENANMRLVQLLALLWTVKALRDIELPEIESCYPPATHVVSKRDLLTTLRSHTVKLKESPEASLTRNATESLAQFQSRQAKQFNSNQQKALEALADHYSQLWPRKIPAPFGVAASPVRVTDYVKLVPAEAAVRCRFETCFANLQLFQYLQRIEQAMSALGQRQLVPPKPITSNPIKTPSALGHVPADDLFAGAGPVSVPSLASQNSLICMQISADVAPGLTHLIETLESTSLGSRYEKSYSDALRDSLVSLQTSTVASSKLAREYSLGDLLAEEQRCAQHADSLLKSIDTALNKTANPASQLPGLEVARMVQQWPRVSPIFVLQQLTPPKWNKLSSEWKAGLVQYGLALIALQRSHRMLAAFRASRMDDLTREQDNIGHTNWDPMDHPETLLLEIESGIIIRPVQEQIASQMRSTEAGRNQVMQLNMGEGKSSVIVPIVAAALADSSRLVRVVVAKPQSKQMAQMLTSKLGGLLNRRVYYMPFSRSLKLDATAADSVGRLVRECMTHRGVLLVQPEHILSFQLMGLECYNSGKEDIGRSLIRAQHFFDTSSRDIVDEADEIFAVKFELIYTVGHQDQITFSPHRWLLIQQVLDIVRQIANDNAQLLGSAIEVTSGPCSSFPRTRLLKPDAEEFFVKSIAKFICQRGLDGFPIARQSHKVRDAVYTYMTKTDLSPEEIAAVEACGTDGFWTDYTKSPLLLLRGLLAGGVLAFTLSQKRWRVNYGLVPDRKPPAKLAVPYRAKDSPTLRSEFSHPDVVIVLTSLSYYYGGLQDGDLFLAFEHLMDSDQADIEYSAWIEGVSTLPSAFRQLQGINLKDRSQCTKEVFPHVRHSKAAVDYFLATSVFPREMKEFPHKLSASGWDLGKTKGQKTTGFSGTIDSRELLPLDVEHLDLPQQKHTNALVLNHLLQKDNSVVLIPQAISSAVSDAERLLQQVKTLDPPCQVILDVGALILELTNGQVAQKWLEMHSSDDYQAAVFVNDEDVVSVLDRTGCVEPLQTSPFLYQLDVCFVFLDEAHTRGIDLKLPAHYRAAVTLGANLTKDRLVQACMRMRKLGQGQTVTFLVPDEIKNKIHACTRKESGADIQLQDVLLWSIRETFLETGRAMPLWDMQGQRFVHQEVLWNGARWVEMIAMIPAQAAKFLEVEAQTLEQRYSPHAPATAQVSSQSQSVARRITEIKQRCLEFEHLQFGSHTLQEEQERELAPEMEIEAQIERPDPAEPAAHTLHPDVKKFVNWGVMDHMSTAYMPAFYSLRDTIAASGFDVSQLAGDGSLLVTADFARTVKTSANAYKSDHYQRPVQWILTSRPGESDSVTRMMIISPYEAQQLLPEIESARNVALHLYRPRVNLSYRSFDRLDFFTIPEQQTDLTIRSSLAMQLNLFAGQLYLSSYNDYLKACKFLNLASSPRKEGEVVSADGFIVNSYEGKLRTSPVNFLHELMSKIRRNGQGIGKTDMGGMLGGSILESKRFDR